MYKYTIYCTQAQIRKALELDAPIEIIDTREIYDKMKLDNRPFEETYNDINCVIIDDTAYLNVTAEQMQEWLRKEKKIFVKICPYVSMNHEDEYDALLVNLYNGHVATVQQGCDNPKIATLTAIDAALEYLSKNTIKNENN